MGGGKSRTGQWIKEGESNGRKEEYVWVKQKVNRMKGGLRGYA